MKAFPGYLNMFISPRTGRLRGVSQIPPLEENYILIGDENDIAIPSLDFYDLTLDFIKLKRHLAESTPILQKPHSIFGKGQALNALEDGILKHTAGIISIATPGTDFMSPTLSEGMLWIGNSENKPVETQIITIDNLPNLGIGGITGLGKIWRGTPSGRPVESDALSDLETTVTFMRTITIPSIQADIVIINGEIALLQGQVAGLLAWQIVVQGELVAISQRINSIHLDLFVISEGPDEFGKITTYRRPTCLLTNIPAGGDVSMDNFRLKNLKPDPVEDYDATSMYFIWALFHDEVEISWP